jgi:Tfp pilus assembly protein PilN
VLIQMKDYNFFEIYETKKGIKINPKSATFIALIIIILCVILSVGLLLRNYLLDMRVQDMKNEIEVKISSQEYAEANRLKQSIDAMKEYDQTAEEVLKKFEEANIIGTEFMKTLVSSLPTAVAMNSINVDNASASFVFTSPDRKVAAELLLNLKNSGLFQDVQLHSITTDPNSNQMSVVIDAVMKASEEK